MRPALPLAVALGLLACGAGLPPDFTTRGGVEVHLNATDAGFSVDSMSDIEDRLTGALVDSGWPERGVRDAIAQAEVYLSAGAVLCAWPVPGGGFITQTPDGDGGMMPTTCFGMETDVRLDIWANPEPAKYPFGCPGRGAYGHELAHLVQLEVRGQNDYFHQDPTVWPNVSRLEAEANNACLYREWDAGVNLP